MVEKMYYLSIDESGRWVAKDFSDGRLLKSGSSIEDLIAKCSERGLQLHSITEEALDQLYWYLSKVRPVFDYIEAEFPGHVYQETKDQRAPKQRGPIGFRVWKERDNVEGTYGER